MTQPAIRPVRPDDVKPLGGPLARAFFDRPMLRFLQPDESKRRKFAEWFFSRTVEYGRRYGLALADDSLSGAAVWLRPGETDMTTWRTFRAGFSSIIFRLGPGGLRRSGQIGDAVGAAHKRHMPGPHWYLLMIGVGPESQGKGLGSALVNAGLERARADGLPAYLETMWPENVRYYEKRGFGVVEEFVIGGEVTSWAMTWRPE